jgi:hypothetical protein
MSIDCLGYKSVRPRLSPFHHSFPQRSTTHERSIRGEMLHLAIFSQQRVIECQRMGGATTPILTFNLSNVSACVRASLNDSGAYFGDDAGFKLIQKLARANGSDGHF